MFDNIKKQTITEFANRMISMMPGHRQDILKIAEDLYGSSISEIQQSVKKNQSLQTPLKDSRYAIEAEVYDSGLGFSELSVGIYDTIEDVYVQDLGCFRAPYKLHNNSDEAEIFDGVEALIWADPESDDYTHKFTVNVNEEYQRATSTQIDSDLAKFVR